MDIGASELIIILIVFLFIFGPGRIMRLGREIGEGIRQFRQGLDPPSETGQTEKKKPSEF